MFKWVSVLILLLWSNHQILANDSQFGLNPLDSTCAVKLSGPIIKPGNLELEPIGSRAAYAWLMSPTFTVDRVVKGIFGGERVVLRKRIPWSFSDSLTGPRLPISKLGIEEARFVGFQQISASELVVPTTDEANRFIDYFNRGVDPNDPLFIKLKGYETLDVRSDDRKIVQRFANNLEVPFSTQGVSTLVVGSLSADNEAITVLQNRVLTWTEFANQLPALSRQNEDFKKLDAKLIAYFSREISGLVKGESLPHLQLSPMKLVTLAEKNANVSPHFSLLFQAYLVKVTSKQPYLLKKVLPRQEQNIPFDLRMARLRELALTATTVN